MDALDSLANLSIDTVVAALPREEIPCDARAAIIKRSAEISALGKYKKSQEQRRKLLRKLRAEFITARDIALPVSEDDDEEQDEAEIQLRACIRELTKTIDLLHENEYD